MRYSPLTLAEYLRWLAADREAGLEIGARAAAHVQKEHEVEKVAAQYWEILKSYTRLGETVHGVL